MNVFDLTIPGATLARELLLAPNEAKEALAQAGFQDPERVLRNLEDLADPRAFGQLPDAFFRDLIDAANPDLALNNFERLVQAAISRAAFLRQLEDRPGLCRLLLRVLGGSPFMADILVRDPESFYWLTDRPERIAESSDYESLLTEFDQATQAVESRDHKLNAIRRTARRELLRIGVGDLAGDRAIQYVAADLSVLADVCLQILIDILMPDLEARYGMPQDANGQSVGFAVIGLGKLGGMELNFSSDIDLMFVYGAEGNTDGGVDGNVVSNQEFFTRLCEQIVRGATEVTEEGFLYRIDMRLRPDGAAGALVMPLSGYEGYYMRRGELWERQMLIKARQCAGSERLGQRFLEMVQPFVYPRYFEVSPAAEIHRIKGRIENVLGRKGQGETHLKLRSGGIRDVEFIVQCLQLLVGRMHKNARSDNTLEAIRQLQRVSSLSEEEAESLKAADV
ncbi:MAG: glutamate-ammonia-ligase adenylyltransferase, partial [Candidatus Latescibacteria bacterium]|nr:glutamate-ammonia-ligase adenylyltransferase [Candidatus Latescibacterota bacterium]